MTDEERKEIEFRAYGKRITFHSRHWWILEWLEEQTGKNLADKVWNVVNRAYQADYAERARKAQARGYAATDAGKRLDAFCEAMGYYSRAGDSAACDRLHQLVWSEAWRFGIPSDAPEHALT